MLHTFLTGVSSNLSQQKSPTADFTHIYFLRTIFRRKYMRKISTVGLFCCDKFEETPKQKVINMSKLNKFYFSCFQQKHQHLTEFFLNTHPSVPQPYHMIIKEFFKIHFLKNYSCISYQATLLYDFLQQYECKIRDKEPSRIYNQYTGS